MNNTLKLAKNLIGKTKKSKKFRLLALALAVKFLISLIAIIAISYLAVNAQNADAAYGLNSDIKQVRTADNPTVYYLDHAHGLKKAYVSAKAFLSYGNKWSDIKVISSEELKKWPEARLVKSAGDNSVYYISKNQKALIKSEQQFIDAGFKWPDIITISQADLAEYKNIDFKVAGGSGSYSNNQLSIALDSLSPKTGLMVINTQDNLAAVFNLTADSKPVEIKKLIIDLKGIFKPELVKEVYLTNESDIEYSYSSSLNNRQAVFNFIDKPITINPGQSAKIKVYVNFYDSSENIINHTFQVIISQASSIGGAKAIGAFPVMGDSFKLTSGVDFLEKVSVSEQSLSIKNNQAVIGLTEKNIGKFNLTESSGASDVFAKELEFTNNGNAQADSLNNFKLKNKAGQIIAIAPAMSNERKLVFKLDNYKIKKSGNETFTVLADIVGGENATINLQLNKAKILSSQGNFNLYVRITNLNENIIIKRETVGVVAKELKANNKVFSQQAGVIIGNFEIRNNNQKIILNHLNFSLEKNSAAPNLIETIYLVDYNSGEVYASFNADKFNSGIANVGLGNLNLKPKQTLAVALITKLPENSPNGSYYKVILNSLEYRIPNGSLFTDTVNSAGAKLIVSKSNLYLYPNNELGGQTFIKGEKNIKIASFIMEGAAGGDTKITGVTFSRGTDSSGAIAFDNSFSNLKFYIGSTKIKTIKSPYTGDFAIDGFSYVLKSGERREIKVYADTETDLQASEIQLAISNIAAVNNNSAIPAVVNNLNVNSHKATFGEAKAEISKVTDGFVTKGEDDNVIAGFKVKNTGVEDLKLDSITVNAAGQELTYSLGYSNLKVVNRDSQRSVGSTVSRPVAGANKISLGGYTVKVGEEIIFDVHVKTNDEMADENIDIYFSDFTAKGKNSRVSALVSGDPTDSYSFSIATGASNGQSNNSNGNGNNGNSNNGQSNGGVTKLIKPVSGSITYGWHDKDYPYRDSVGEHTGIDIAVIQSTSVKAAADGTVIEVYNGGLTDQASYIAVSHNGGLVTKYVHLSRLDVKAGDKVKQGDIIGLSGGTPGTAGAGAYTNGAHLHFEVLRDGAAVDPEKYL
ncbi:MAG: M23 family metallopeptidase [Patescibacteria group bacterium]|nr:M23 family metallopeptidase [Patescibacteria group bacterium]